jgi:hypothetical protein
MKNNDLKQKRINIVIAVLVIGAIIWLSAEHKNKPTITTTTTTTLVDTRIPCTVASDCGTSYTWDYVHCNTIYAQQINRRTYSYKCEAGFCVRTYSEESLGNMGCSDHKLCYNIEVIEGTTRGDCFYTKPDNALT